MRMIPPLLIGFKREDVTSRCPRKRLEANYTSARNEVILFGRASRETRERIKRDEEILDKLRRP